MKLCCITTTSELLRLEFVFRNLTELFLDVYYSRIKKLRLVSDALSRR
jgi:hypothetical protein